MAASVAVGGIALTMLVARGFWDEVADRDGAVPTRLVFTSDGMAIDGPLHSASLPGFVLRLSSAILIDQDGRTVLTLNSPGGNVDVALLMRWVIASFQWITRVDTRVAQGATCQSACTIVFAAGRARLAGPNARFMFHAPRLADAQLRGPTDPDGTIAAEAEARYLTALASVDPELVRRLKREGAFDSPAPTFLSGRDLVRGGWRFVTALETRAPDGWPDAP